METKSILQLQQTAAQLIALGKINHSLQFNCPEHLTLTSTINDIFNLKVPHHQIDQFFKIYEAEQTAQNQTAHQLFQEGAFS